MNFQKKTLFSPSHIILMSMISQPHTMLRQVASTTSHGSVESAQHQYDDDVALLSSRCWSRMFRCSKKRSRETWDEEEEAMKSSSSSSSLSSSAAPAAKQMRITTVRLLAPLCRIKEDVLRYLMEFVLRPGILVDDLKNILFVNKFFKGIVLSYLDQFLLKSSFSISRDFATLNQAFEMLAVLSMLPNYNPKKKVTLKLKKGVHVIERSDRE